MALGFFEADERYYELKLAGNRLSSGGPQPFAVRGWVPESFRVSTQAQFEAKIGSGLVDVASQYALPLMESAGSALGGVPLAGRLLGGLAGAATGVARTAADLLGNGGMAALTGVSDLTQAMTLQTWVNSSPMQFSFPLLFNSRVGAKQDVHYNILELLKLPLPWKKTVGGLDLLAGPGVSFLDLVRKEDKIENVSMRVGRFCYIPVVLVESVDVEVTTMSDPEGYFTAARADISVSTPWVPVRDDIDTWFRNSPDGQTAGNMLGSDRVSAFFGSIGEYAQGALGRLGI